MKGKEALDTIYHELNQRHLDWYADEEVDNKIVDILRNELSKNYLTIKAELEKLDRIKEVVDDEWEGRQMGSVLPKIKQIIEEETNESNQ